MVETLSRAHFETERNERSDERREIFVGIDVHKDRWHETARERMWSYSVGVLLADGSLC